MKPQNESDAPKKYTPGGQRIYAEFLDEKRTQVSVEEVPGAERRRCWVFGLYAGMERSPYLSPTQARRLAKALLEFADGR